MSMRRIVSASAKAIATNATRRTFHSLKVVAPRVKSCMPAVRFNSNLTEVITKELVDEESSPDVNLDLVDVQKTVLKNFKLSEELGVAEVKLTRQLGDEKIEIRFNVQDIVGGDEEDEFADETAEQDEDEEVEPSASGINFEIDITKGKNTLQITCLANEGLEVLSVAHINKEVDIEGEVYGGPEFRNLSEELQSAFYEYLADRKIDDDLGFFVLAYSAHKEQLEYVNWLKQVQDFTAEK
mmetsp:Transcript_48149/g.111856  ORF Transcript_48149/g.111856 Transcript_48149/m.111856 type:complete len:240 (-) Transcript_48149:77-796(-)